MIGIIDYDAGNIRSVEKALQYLGQETVVSRDPQVLLKADKVILPGVGSFGAEGVGCFGEWLELVFKRKEHLLPVSGCVARCRTDRIFFRFVLFQAGEEAKQTDCCEQAV